MSLIVLLVIVYLGLYVLLSIPSVQRGAKLRISEELSRLTGGELGIGNLTVSPFSEVRMTDVWLDSPEGERCAGIKTIAAGIDLWSLFSERRIVLNYAELIGLDGKVVQSVKDGPLNIQFLIDALSPKDKDKPPTPFDIRIRNVVVRDSRVSISRPWMADASGTSYALSDITVSKLRMDLSIPVLRNDFFSFDIRNIQFDVTPGIEVRGLSARVSYSRDLEKKESDKLSVKDLNISFPNSSLTLGDVDLKLRSLDDFHAVVNGHVTPSDFRTLIPSLDRFGNVWNIRVDASLKGKKISVNEMMLDEAETSSSISVRGEVEDYSRKDSLDVTVEEFHADLSSRLIADAIGMNPKIGDKARQALRTAGRVQIGMEGYLRSGETGEVKGSIDTDGGDLVFTATGFSLNSQRPQLKLSAEADDLDFGKFLSTDKLGKVSMNLEAEAKGNGKTADGRMHLTSDKCEVLGNRLSAIDLTLMKKGGDVDMVLEASSDGMRLEADGSATLAGKDSSLDLAMTMSGFNPSAFGAGGKTPISTVAGHLDVAARGNNPDNLTGQMELTDASVTRTDGRQLHLSRLSVSIDSVANKDNAAGLRRDINIACDWFDGNLVGVIHPGSLGRDLKKMASSVFPTLLSGTGTLARDIEAENDFTFRLNLKGESAPYVFFDLPVRPLTDIPLSGYVRGPEGKAAISVSTPHLLQGKNKLIRDVSVNAELDGYLGMARVNGGLIFPAKKGDAELAADIYAMGDKVKVNLGINPTLDSSVKGGMAFTASFSRLSDPFKPAGELAVDVSIEPSTVTVSDKTWNISDGSVEYSGKRISINDFLISHDSQFVRIDGIASESPDDFLKVRLNDIDLEYIFNLLNINYVSFGGMATGEVVGSRLLTGTPKARTEYLRVKGISYNGAVLGDGDLASDYDSRQQRVGIYAVIRDSLTRQQRISVDGGIWVTRDSLSFAFDADKVNVGIMKPFVAAFCSDLYGEASGKCKLYGTFSDIDLVGDLQADTLSMKLDFTNTWYHAGGDSVFLHKGMIDIPPLTLYDDEGHTAEFSGWLRHTYFHNPVFNFRLRDAQSILCYDTNAQINPLWYGTIYGTGHAQINGHPGQIDIDMNMTTEEGSKFYYVISDAEDVAQYSFLTFTDRRKEMMEEASNDTVPDYLKRFQKQTESSETGSSNVILSLKGTVTNEALVTLVMDPKAGDNITARGQGALQMDYNLASNDLRMIGTYVLDEGNYNFTLQDIIIKNFNIRKGSLIKFNGDPMNATLDITATYRVNTNLTDLDESFASDKELNRTNVPVDAVLLVDGPMTNPDITFDIELPTLTSDVERKVKSIVSTNDMMSRQIIYLLAMNRFYTPEYTGGSNKGTGAGSEWSSLASSTISSQLSNILSQMTDKLDVSPSFRSDKGDFTDMEFDLALSSRLLNNRLLINGNFGYRDKSTSNTQFIGDFDIEYLLSKNGNLRLKAYNHFNDQNYYLRSALTTQGVGVVFRRDFDGLFKRRKRELDSASERQEAASDSMPEVGKEVIIDKEKIINNQ